MLLSLLAAAQFAFAPNTVASHAVAPHAVAPHARVVVGESGLDAVSAAALPVINQLLSGGITVPDMTLTVHVPAQKQLDDHDPICRNVGNFGHAHDEQHGRSPVRAAALGSRSCVAER